MNQVFNLFIFFVYKVLLDLKAFIPLIYVLALATTHAAKYVSPPIKNILGIPQTVKAMEN